MIIRVVRLTLHPIHKADFLELFDAASRSILAFDGCEHLELLEDAESTNVLTTYSLWTDESALNRYRSSDFFKHTWSKVKPLFSASPVAHSYHKIRDIS